VGAGPPAPEAAVVHAPLAVLPAPFPTASFRKACDAALAFNSLIAAVAADSEYLQRTLAPAAEYDDFTVRTRCTAVDIGSHRCFCKKGSTSIVPR
jgi:glutathione synthase